MNELITHHSTRKKHTTKDSMHMVNEGIPRLGKALDLLSNVTFTTENTGMVQSQNDPSKQYSFVLSDDGRHTCSCPDYQFRQMVCKHLRSAILKQTYLKMTQTGANLP